MQSIKLASQNKLARKKKDLYIYIYININWEILFNYLFRIIYSSTDERGRRGSQSVM